MLNQIHLPADGVARRPLLAGDMLVVGGLPLACGLLFVDGTGMSVASSNKKISLFCVQILKCNGI